MKYEKWTRICVGPNDYYDVIEDYNTVDTAIRAGKSDIASFTSILDAKVSIRVDEVSGYYEHGIDYLKDVWERSNEIEKIEKETTPSWE